ncbi:hypothetical protein MRB53_000175 [Persea americana]|uniref:Uncharacterized protein n=1 Tax=Persea americana TaxID=3435 RepID=A0ACC2MN66_PERAE|nr:hypothetical protein MRB53_000175 [Persea americana]
MHALVINSTKNSQHNTEGDFQVGTKTTSFWFQMAVCSQEKVDPYVQKIVDGTRDFTSGTGEDASTHSYCLDVVPVFDNSSIPVTLECPYESSQDQDYCSISGFSEKQSINPHSSSDVALLSFLEIPASYPFESQICSDVRKNCGNYIDLKIESAENYMSCGLGIQFAEEYFDDPKITVENLKPMTTEGVLNTVLLRKSSLQVGVKIFQSLAEYSTMLLKGAFRVAKTALPLHWLTDKCTNDRGLDANCNRHQRYKRSTSFNSRKIVLFSSILSSMGTMVLIYLTLRVKQISDGLRV